MIKKIVLILVIVLSAITMKGQGSLGATEKDLRDFYKGSDYKIEVWDKKSEDDIKAISCESERNEDQFIYYFNDDGYVEMTLVIPLSARSFVWFKNFYTEECVKISEREYHNYYENGFVKILMYQEEDRKFPNFVIGYFPY